MPDRSRKRPRDPNQLAKSIVGIATDDQPVPLSPDAAKSAAAALGRRGGLKGGPARAEALSPKKRSEIARKAARTRWQEREDG